VNAGTAANILSAATAFDQTNNHAIENPGPMRRLLVRLINTGGAKTVTFRAGTNPPAFQTDEGDLAVSMGGTVAGGTPVATFVVLESARFMGTGGSILVDLAGTPSGAMDVYRLGHA
jgi:hypothetical protein